MAGSFDNYQVLYAPNAPAEDIRLGQLFVDESEAAPLDMLKVCTSLGPPVYTSLNEGILGSLVAGNGIAIDVTDPGSPILSVDATDDFTWTGVNLWSAAQPQMRWAETDQASGGIAWRLRIDAGVLRWSVYSDDFSTTEREFLNVVRTSTAVTSINLGNSTDNPPVNSGGVYRGPVGSVSAPSFSFVGDNDTGLFRGATDAPSIAAAGEEVARFASGTIPLRIFDRAASDATRYSIVTTGNSERGYWGFPTAGSGTMITRNIVGTIHQFRTSNNTTEFEIGDDYAKMPTQVQRTGVISPAQITANTDNWNPTGLASASIIRLTTDASRNLTGIVAQPSGTVLTLINVGTTDVVLIDDATSTAANRFQLTANMTVSANECVHLWYDGTSSRWRAISVCLTAVT